MEGQGPQQMGVEFSLHKNREKESLLLAKEEEVVN
jgi:hypothetical protein